MSQPSRIGRVLALSSTLAFALAGTTHAKVDVDIPFQEFTLPNGLRVIVHEDRKAPVVAVNIWYHVGSKDEPVGKSGFAHLFEHLMFQGSENHDGEFFGPFELVGATNQNGTTNSDRTNYFQNVPTTALDMALWMESDRMGHLLGAVTQELLDEQRGVVQNEKRQGENQPYGRVWDQLSRSMYPVSHPYHHSVIGSMEDLNSASLDDVKTWFRDWYGPNNAVLVLAGDIDLATAKAKTLDYFGDIPASATVPKLPTNIAPRTESTRETMTDRVAQPRIYRAWNVPEFGNAQLDHLQLVAQILGGSKSSRLDRRLVHQDKLVDSVSAFAMGSELGSGFAIIANVRNGVDVKKVEAVLAEEVKKFVADGPTQAELDQARIVFEAGFVRGVERIGGFGGKADVLAECAVFMDDPGCFRDSLATLDKATTADLKAAAAKWLAQGDHTLVVEPGDTSAASAPEPERVATESDKAQPEKVLLPDPNFTVVASKVDRSKGVPETKSFPDLRFPALQRATLSNGIDVILAERHEIPVVQLSMEFDAGYTADLGRKLGTASFTMGMLDEGAAGLDALALADRTQSLGAVIGAGASLDGSNVYVSALKPQLDPSLSLFADVIRKPDFADKEIDRVRQTWLAGIAQEKTRPNGVANRVLPPLLYGKGHPYAIPFSGSGDEASIKALERDDLVAFHRDFIRPDNATLIVVGDTTLKEIVPLLEKHFADWKAPEKKLPVIEVAKVELQPKPRVFLIDQPGAVQANILVGQVVNPTGDPKALDFDIANGVLGGEFSSRLNMKLREEKQWAYGAYSYAIGAKGQRPWIASAAVQIDRTADSIRELQTDIAQFASNAQAASDDEIAKIKRTNVLSLPGSYETAGAVMGAIGGIVRYGRPDNYVETLKERTEAVSAEAVHAAAGLLKPDALTWVVVGDLSKIEQPVRDLKLGEVSVLDADGKPLR
ncbi:M16 family metallopeptidase [Chiayiivirga flava]|uniref:Putative Zn-dependent peptidase n=1 Tax=Chiayiivirga flava TaxID=659595 RepID=A0A7W8G001_9GAMM|nr:pitrilysin family protein [Chiayiivirga flava]MBB5207744.1 putative Zn-dependent peptidase [Chiayiivirga flava]